jgi:hypothetical protein
MPGPSATEERCCSNASVAGAHMCEGELLVLAAPCTSRAGREQDAAKTVADTCRVARKLVAPATQIHAGGVCPTARTAVVLNRKQRMSMRDSGGVPALGGASPSGSVGPALGVSGAVAPSPLEVAPPDVSRAFLSFSASALSHRWLMQPIGHI